jgi:Skp family chaperone for outer membrane proteins
VKKSVGWAVSATVLSLCFLASAALAQGPVGVPSGPPAQPAGGPRMAVLDVSAIFKASVRFKAWMEEMKAEVQRAEVLIREERDRIGKLEERLQQFTKGTQDYKDMEEDITKKKADLTVKVQIQGKQFEQRQAKIYYSVYQEILQATDYFCRQHSIDMVFQFKCDAVDPEQAQSVIPFINKQVVWYAPDLDITKFILAEVNRTAINPPRAAERPATPFGNNQPPQQR